MYVARIPNRGSPPAILLRESYRDGGKVKNRTLANLTCWPEEKVHALAAVLKGDASPAQLAGAFSITRSLPHGHVAAVLATMEALGFNELLAGLPGRVANLVEAIVCAQVIAPASKFAISQSLRTETATSSLGEVLGVQLADEDDLYAAMDEVIEIQEEIEAVLAARHLSGATLVLYDVSTAALEGRCCPLGAIGHPKDGVRGRLQIVYGLLTTTEGIPVAIEVFEGNTADPTTLSAQIAKVKERFCITSICLVGDRGMLTKARLAEDVIPAGLDYITALRSPQIKALVADETIQLSLFDQMDLFEVSHPDFPGERLVACRNPFLAEERARKRTDLLDATESQLAKIQASIRRQRRPLRGKDSIGLAVGKVIGRYKVAKHFAIEISDNDLTFTRRQDKIADEAALDGIYVLRTSLEQAAIDTSSVVSSYKALEMVERAFRDFNTELDIRPIRHRLAPRVKAHVFLRMLSYHVTWHMKQALSPILFKDDDKASADALRPNPVAPAQRSPRALSKAAKKRTHDRLPVHSFKSLLADLSTICVNRVTPTDVGVPGFQLVTQPTPLQRRAFELLGADYRYGYM